MNARRRKRADAVTLSRLLGTLAAVCFAIAIIAGVSDRPVAATATDTSVTQCPHQRDGKQLWEPSDSDLHLILARHRGYDFQRLDPDRNLQGADDASLEDKYLDQVFPDWQKEARKNPEKANLCNAYLAGANLGKANLSNAYLSGANLSDAGLREANLTGANLSGGKLFGADLRGAHLREAHLADVNLGRGEGREMGGRGETGTAKWEAEPGLNTDGSPAFHASRGRGFMACSFAIARSIAAIAVT